MLQQILSEKIPSWQKDLKKILDENGDSVISEVTVAQAIKGMRGVKGLVCDTSAVSADKGLIIRGHPVMDITHILPEEVFYLLLTGDLPNQEQLADLQNQLIAHQDVPEYVWKVIDAMPENSHPMTMLSIAIQSMRVDSLFVEKFNEGTRKDDYWKWILEDGIKLIGALPSIAAAIYRKRINETDRIDPDSNLDWAGNFAHMLGVNENDDFKKLMRLYLMLHSDHEGGNVSAFSSLTVASSLSSPFLAIGAGLNGLAGPLHGLANQECLKFVLEIRDHFNGAPTNEELVKFCWDRLNDGRVIPGYGHAVLRCPDPRFSAFMKFGKEHIHDDDVFKIVEALFEVVPPVLNEHGKAKNPWPNVDAVSGSLLYYYGLKEFNYYTVLFSLSRVMGIVSQIVINRALRIPITRPKSVTIDWLKNNI
ncbi:MAG: citrate (Si)-synthase [Candidatus Neomarinimicrobiota bacterium]|jgi:citrate synthase|nr:citrate (Si)-synthase [Candidatus Neomarinimicrobiota bacterium]MEC7872123.1 citrate (Si)-synthase [Candidatus Neomarinimicrobiota bacterium]MEC9437525.1 citrate (Si)-synthase [Candidatus Neomarinimicrobiota bacterium]MEC9474468.1 citrate (Si)-synthase [Candidatus Neomarinimicrobiota bacterium]MED5247958.1 citrate (Si)-synthase [Candidatus Neomarinimicrobiota bacterium]|tara:strand:- start:6274 stop:7536 length:1263 start_codon:yes stop_codon:yes gene_type:complete